MLSIDITDRQIKLVRGVHSGNKIRVQDADMRELTLGMVSNGYITDVPMVAACLLYTSPSPRDMRRSRMPSSA